MDARFLFMICFILALLLTYSLGIIAENIFFSTSTRIEHLQPILDSEPAPTILEVEKYTTILSQPLRHSFKWNDKRKAVVDWSIYLDGLGHGKACPFFVLVA